MIERRAHERQRTYLSAVLEFNDGRSTFDCLIRNASRAGARICISGTIVLPDTAYLRVKKSERRVPVRLAWRSHSACGFEFTGWTGNLV